MSASGTKAGEGVLEGLSRPEHTLLLTALRLPKGIGGPFLKSKRVKNRKENCVTIMIKANSRPYSQKTKGVTPEPHGLGLCGSTSTQGFSVTPVNASSLPCD